LAGPLCPLALLPSDPSGLGFVGVKHKQSGAEEGWLVKELSSPSHTFFLPFSLSDLWRLLLLCCFLATKLVKDVTFPFGFELLTCFHVLLAGF